MKVLIINNPTSDEVASCVKKHKGIDPAQKNAVLRKNGRVHIIKGDAYIAVVHFVPEYVSEKHMIKSVEINILYEKATHTATIIGYHSSHFFKKYHPKIISMQFTSFSSFIEKWFEIVFEDQRGMIEHILSDTKRVHKEYIENHNSESLIRHLTRNQINITTLKLVINTQESLLDRIKIYIRDYEQSIVNYQRVYINAELEYAKEFCEMLMDSINTQFQVKMSDTFYAYTKFTFIFFLSGAVFQIGYMFVHDADPLKLTFWICSLLSLIGTLLMFRRFG